MHDQLAKIAGCPFLPISLSNSVVGGCQGWNWNPTNSGGDRKVTSSVIRVEVTVREIHAYDRRTHRVEYKHAIDRSKEQPMSKNMLNIWFKVW
eukprot:g27522.t1